MLKIKSLTTCLLIVMVLAVCAIAATAEELKEKAWGHLVASAAKQQHLKTKVYTGTFAEILAVRVADVNDVTCEIDLAQSSTAELAQVLNDPNNVRDAVKALIAEKTKEQENKSKKHNTVFLLGVEEVLADPENAPAPDDLEEQLRREEFRVACLELVNQIGGI